MSGYLAEIIADSVAPHGARLTTFKLRFPRFVLAEFNTHRALSRNARSSRAVPVRKMIEEVEIDPVIPVCWGKNKPGMQADERYDSAFAESAQEIWCDAASDAVSWAESLAATGVHKQIANRLLEPFMWADVVATATAPGWLNFFALRCHADAQPEMRRIAVMMARAYRESKPTPLHSFMWHLPFVTEEELARLCGLRNGQDSMMETVIERELIRLSVARCARVSYRMFDGQSADRVKDLAKADELEANGHWSPFEHQAHPGDWEGERSANFVGWRQYRQALAKSVHATFNFSTLGQWA